MDRKFSDLVMHKVIECEYILSSLKTLEKLKTKNIPCFVISGTPQNEIKTIVKRKLLEQFFMEVHGSPRSKTVIVADILHRWNFDEKATIFLGDALSDYDVAQKNNTALLGIVPKKASSVFPVGTCISPETNLEV